jgi:hypothetical protein
MPAATPVTTPVEPTEAIAPLLLLQLPPAVTSASAVVAPVHTLAVPVILAGLVLMVTVTVVIFVALTLLAVPT